MSREDEMRGRRRVDPDDLLLSVVNMCNAAFVPMDHVEPVLAERGISIGEFKKLKRRLKRGPQRAQANQLGNDIYQETMRRNR